MAILEALDRDLDERGLVDKGGDPRYLLNHRSRICGQLDSWLAKIAPTMERQMANREPPARDGRSDYVAELQRIALGQDTTATARDRVSALKELVDIDSEPGPVTQVHMTFFKDAEGNPILHPDDMLDDDADVTNA